MNHNIKILHWKDCSVEIKKKVLSRPSNFNSNDIYVKKVVSKIFNDVKSIGDEAIRKYTKSFDNVELSSFSISEKQIFDSEFVLNLKVKKFIEVAKNNILKFHQRQNVDLMDFEIQSGILCKQIIRPIQSIGLYIPGGVSPLISTALMLAIPANIAKCKNIIICSPPPISSEILYVSKICGIKKVFQIGGAQAIFAMAFGTETIPKVNKIFGPGNIYVTEAKSQVKFLLKDVSIDMLAGPSEILIIADLHADPSIIASDLLSQMEHGSYSQALLVTPSFSLAKHVILEINSQLKTLLKKDTICFSLKHSSIIVTENLLECFEISNLYAPEHLMIQCKNSIKLLDYVINAGSIFLGKWSAVSCGDYATGTNHVLPTYGSAVFDSGLTIRDFQKIISVQKLNKTGLLNISSTVLCLSKLERMEAHSNSILKRLCIIQDQD